VKIAAGTAKAIRNSSSTVEKVNFRNSAQMRRRSLRSDIPLRRSEHLVVIEEHVAQGGLGQSLALSLAKSGEMPRRFSHRCAVGYPSGRYGSQKFHRREWGLDPAAIVEFLRTADA